MTTAQTIHGRTAMPGRVTTRAATTAMAYTAASAVLAFAALHDAQARPAHAISWLLIAAAVLCGELIVVDLPGAGQPVRLDMSAVPVVVGALFCPPRRSPRRCPPGLGVVCRRPTGLRPAGPGRP